jgi:hypothetical protein
MISPTANITHPHLLESMLFFDLKYQICICRRLKKERETLRIMHNYIALGKYHAPASAHKKSRLVPFGTNRLYQFMNHA